MIRFEAAGGDKRGQEAAVQGEKPSVADEGGGASAMFPRVEFRAGFAAFGFRAGGARPWLPAFDGLRLFRPAFGGPAVGFGFWGRFGHKELYHNGDLIDSNIFLKMFVTPAKAGAYTIYPIGPGLRRGCNLQRLFKEAVIASGCEAIHSSAKREKLYGLLRRLCRLAMTFEFLANDYGREKPFLKSGQATDVIVCALKTIGHNDEFVVVF